MNPRLRTAIIAAIVFVVCFDLAWFWQHHLGAHSSELGGHPDEAAHYVTGLMVHDYVEAGFPGSPMGFAKTYYDHYPKIGLGIWPPVFYAVQTAWTLVLGTQRGVLLWLMAVLAAVLAVQVFRALASLYGAGLAVLGALATVCLPLAVEYYSMVMAETLCAVLMFGAVVAWGRFLDEERGRDAILFGLLAGLAIMTKGTGLALALAAPLALAMARRWKLLLRPAVWGAVLLVGIIAGPWTWLFRNLGREKGGWLEASPSWHFSAEAAPYYLGKLGLALGSLCDHDHPIILGPLLLLAVVGAFARIFRPGPQRGLWASTGGLILGVLIFQAVLPVGLEARHLISILPAAILFAVSGFETFRRWLRHRQKRPDGPANAFEVALAALILAVGVFLAHRVDPLEPKNCSGFAALAAAVLEDPEARNKSVLIASDATGEGMFISEYAMRDQNRPGGTVKRASKETASMDWAGRGVRLRFASDEELIAWIQAAKIGCIITDTSMPEEKRGPHHDQLIHLCEEHSDAFWPAAASPIIRAGQSLPKTARLYLVRPGTP